ncbi:TlpA family protein disulfide reductase, partial [Mycolicibacterium fallax]|uniref:TlpA family protein disulfide reductase n=1 Tax=Mycolicibacterium fallax TaxID=1793 RepID=UPI00390893F5
WTSDGLLHALLGPDHRQVAAAGGGVRLVVLEGGGDGTEVAALAEVTVACAADGDPVRVGPALAVGTPVVLNLWAYWCAPCAAELPALAEYQRRAGDTVTVVTVHQDRNEAAGVARLAELGVRLPTLQDADRRIAGALGVPNVMPATVVLRADGTVAQILPREFAHADEVEAAVAAALEKPR